MAPIAIKTALLPPRVLDPFELVPPLGTTGADWVGGDVLIWGAGNDDSGLFGLAACAAPAAA